MRQYIVDSSIYTIILKKLKDKYDIFQHILVDDILVVIDTEFEIKAKAPKKLNKKSKKGKSQVEQAEEIELSQEEIDKLNEKKKKAWKFKMSAIPKIYQDVMENGTKEFILIVRQSLVNDLNDAQVFALLYSELRKINREGKLEKPNINTFSDLISLIGDIESLEEGFNLKNILE